MFVLGFWDCVWSSFSLDPKRYTLGCVHCSKPFISASKKKKHCSDALSGMNGINEIKLRS